MQIEVIYNHGRIEFPERMRFTRQRFKVRIDVPDEEIEALPAAQINAQSAGVGWNSEQDFHPETIAALERLGAIKQAMLAMPDEKFPELSAEQEARISAFRCREDR